MAAAWGEFRGRRAQRLVQQERHGIAAEKVAENILEDLFTVVLDWQLSDLNNQLGFADLVLTSQGVKYLVVELKRPGALAWNRRGGNPFVGPPSMLVQQPPPWSGTGARRRLA
jgi:hypothetical protein